MYKVFFFTTLEPLPKMDSLGFFYSHSIQDNRMKNSQTVGDSWGTVEKMVYFIYKDFMKPYKSYSCIHYDE